MLPRGEGESPTLDAMWDNENPCLSLQLQNAYLHGIHQSYSVYAQQLNEEIGDLQGQVEELCLKEAFWKKAQDEAKEACEKRRQEHTPQNMPNSDSLKPLTVEAPKASGIPDKKDKATQLAREALAEVKKAPRGSYHLASAALPHMSALRQAMQGDDLGDPDLSSKDSDSDFGAEPESDHDSDSEGTKRAKRLVRRKYHAKLTQLKYQQGFLKHEPPFIYKGECQAGLFEKWVREVREWIKRGRLTTQQGIKLSGKYLAHSAYNFFEWDILDLKKRYTLSEYFESMFDYLFPPDFHMQQ
ncbi:hypothetical protein PAXINDRAFT_15531 [Paxillus involutus ATCC 200175]|uniref:Unplaced genomic scaffold PAXINscaffold_54, whole genome shotgun sequence n=1 Tax=Paxillus involutus ATCC 200175 TaxID=664439 RepID=A0A0C9TWG0_PAXIN|nr:hypothetical protein PAXINDRAFT_15531 [Paxillus involutus ATCC 200175]